MFKFFINNKTNAVKGEGERGGIAVNIGGRGKAVGGNSGENEENETDPDDI